VTITRDRYRILSTGDVNVDVYGASASQVEAERLLRGVKTFGGDFNAGERTFRNQLSYAVLRALPL